MANGSKKPLNFERKPGEFVPSNLPDPQQIIELPEKLRREIDEWLLRYPPEQKRSGVFFALRRVQEENGGSLTVGLMDAVAAHLGMPKIAVYEVAAFYTMYHLKPVGKHVVEICTNISCMLNGAEEILEHVKEKLKVDLNETTTDGQFTLKEVECLGACVAAPVCQIGKDYHENLTKEKIDKLLAGLG